MDGDIISRHKNLTGKVLSIIGIAVILLGIIAGFVFATSQDEFYEEGIKLQVFFQYLINGIIVGMLFIGLAEVIRLLDKINNKMEPLKTDETNISNQETAVIHHMTGGVTPGNWKVSVDEKEKIEKLYFDKKMLEIIPSKLEGYCIVQLLCDNKEITKIVDVGGFGAKEVVDQEVQQTILSDPNNPY